MFIVYFTLFELSQAIVDWPESKIIHEIWSFHGLASFYCWFIKGFSAIMSPITDCMKQGEFIWTKAATKAFNEVKQKMTEAPVMRLPDFTKPFEVECDASSIGIEGYLVKSAIQLFILMRNWMMLCKILHIWQRILCHYLSSLALAPLPVVSRICYLL